MALREIKGIGRVYEEKLMEAGIHNAEELVVADIKKLAEKTGINEERLRNWQREAKKMVEYKKAEVIEDVSKITSILIEKNRATVKIKNIVHKNVPVYNGNFDELKENMEKEEMAVYLKGKARLWFNGEWYENIPYKLKEVKKEERKKKKGFFEKLMEWWKK